ncbi:subtilisin-like protein [Trametes polyzona]|nr:subtilisin-like protein [Trametes polyzona]
MRLVSLSLAATLVALAAALPSRRHNLVLHEKRAMEPVDWTLSRKLEPDAVLPMRFGLTQNNLHRIEEMLMSVAHPNSPTYGQHFSPEDVVDIFAPSDETIRAVTEWLVESGIRKERLRLTASKGWIEVNTTTAEVEDLINAEYHVYTHSSGAQQIGCHSYSVPEHIREHIDLIQPTVHFLHRLPPRTDQMQKRSLGPSGNIEPAIRTGPKTDGKKVTITPGLEDCDQHITLDCLRALYSIDYTPQSTDKNTFGILELTPQAFLQSDLDLFFANFSPSQVGTSPVLVSIDGGMPDTNRQNFGLNGESDLDLQYAFGLTNPQPILLLQAGDLIQGASFNNWLDAVDGSFCTFEGGDDPTQDGIYPDPVPGGFNQPESCGIIKPPFVVSASYGQDEGSVTQAYAARQCAEYGKLGMLGTTVVYSTGDNGVAGNGGFCLGPDGKLSISLKKTSWLGTRFSPDFPVSCPFVTGIGATQINPGSTVNDPESACEQVIFSGGGFSNFFALPDYQATAVTSFLQNHPPPFTSEQFNNSGNVRAFPDISANGANYVVAVDGDFVSVFGTSCSAPVVGSMITLINDARITAGKGPVGFINPALYSDAFADSFHDITTGNNPGCNTDGFNATEGWDPVTGLGTPNFTVLLSHFLDLP